MSRLARAQVQFVFIAVTMSLAMAYACVFLIVGAVLALALAYAAGGDRTDSPLWVVTVVAVAGTIIAMDRAAPALMWFRGRVQATVERLAAGERRQDDQAA